MAACRGAGQIVVCNRVPPWAAQGTASIRERDLCGLSLIRSGQGSRMVRTLLPSLQLCRHMQRGIAGKALQDPVGITAFLGGHKRFAGKMKTRYEDFIVKEISKEGEVVESSKEGSLPLEFRSLKASTGKHARMVLAKENRDVADAVAMLAKHLRIDARKIAFHGLKDRRAVTYQHISVPWELLNEELLASSMSSSTWDRAVHISNLTRQDTHCHLGWMLGNDFCIALRAAELHAHAVPVDPGAARAMLMSQIEEASRNLCSIGFVNYFGRQRFGPSACSPLIGKAMVCGHHEMACRHIVCSMREDAVGYFEHLFARREFKKALAETPARCAVERRVLRHLCASPDDYRGALGSIPRRQRLFFARAFASLLWNKAP